MSPLTLLVIDDEPQVRRFLRSSLASTDYKLIEAATGESGLVEAASKRPDVILLDLGLPDLDGIVVTRRLRECRPIPKKRSRLASQVSISSLLPLHHLNLIAPGVRVFGPQDNRLPQRHRQTRHRPRPGCYRVVQERMM